MNNFSNGYGNSPTPTKALEGSCEKVMVLAQNRVENPHWQAIIKNCNNSFETSLQGYQLPSESQDGLFCYGKLPLALYNAGMRTIEWQTPQLLSWLSNPLDAWSSALKRTQVTQAPGGRRPMELELSESKTTQKRKTKGKRSKRKPEKSQQRGRQRIQEQRQRTRGCRSASYCITSCNPTMAVAGDKFNCNSSSYPADSNSCLSVQCGMVGCHTQVVSRHHAGPRGHPEGSGEGRKSFFIGSFEGFEQGILSSGQGSTTADQH